MTTRAPDSARDKSFDRIAASYDEVRPGYPGALYDRIIEFGSLTTAAPILEAGTGTGKATLPFAERGFTICGLEPGADMAAIARSNLARFPQVSVTTTKFEDWNAELSGFGLAFSAQAFHWIDPSQRLPKTATCLQPRGVLAIFGNVPQISPGPLHDELEACYQKLAMSLPSQRGTAEWYGSSASPLMTELSANRAFHDVHFEAFDWQRSLGASSYCKLLSTYSDHSTMPPASQAELQARVADILHRHGGTVTLIYKTGLFLARRA